MKKIIILTTALTMAAVANAANWTWEVQYLTNYDPATAATPLFSGVVEIYASGMGSGGVDLLLSSATANDQGRITGASFTTNDSVFEPGQSYSFLIKYVDTRGTTATSDDMMFILPSAEYASVPCITGVTGSSISFGNLGQITGNTVNWTPVPEPTSGLLLLIGVAGLALRRKRA